MPRQTTVHPKQARAQDTSRDEADRIADHDAERAGKQAGSTIAEEAGDWLDEIDEALAENIDCALEFWRAYQQRGGQ